MAKGTTNRLVFKIATALYFVVVALLLVSTNMQKELSHDEHMYVAGGYLLGKHLAVPYRDYPYLQMPNLAFAYAGIFQGTDHLLLVARLFNTLCSVLSLGVIFYLTSSVFGAARPAVRFLVAAGTALLVVTSPIFIYASGLAWNHDLPILLALLATALYCSPAARTGARWPLLVSGLLVGAATTTRLSFALLLLPFVGAVLLLSSANKARAKLRSLWTFSVGALLGLLPAILLATTAPTNFLFDNWRYHQLNELYWQQLGYDRAMTVAGKLTYLKGTALEPGNLALVLAFALLALPAAVRVLRAGRDANFPLLFMLLLLPFLLAGALAPTPVWYQYFYVLVPFLALTVIYGVAHWYSSGKRWVLTLFAAAVLVSGAYAWPQYVRLNASLSPQHWAPVKAHALGAEIKHAVGEGKVLTLAPIFPLEGGADIYRELAAGPFSWRIAPHLTSGERKQLVIISGEDLEDFLRADPPKGIFVGFEVGLETPLADYARAHGYTPLTLSSGATLWLLPARMSP